MFLRTFVSVVIQHVKRLPTDYLALGSINELARNDNDQDDLGKRELSASSRHRAV
jgi:hypothetical protein